MITLSNRIRVLLIMLSAASAVLGESRLTHAEETQEQAMVAVNPKDLKFTPIPDMPSCVSAAILRGNPRNGPAWVMLKLASGCRVPLHWHTANEDLVVISGQGTMAMTGAPPLQLVPGAYASLPSHHTHQASCTRTCLMFSISDGAYDIHYVDAKGEELSLEKALKQLPKPKRKKK